MIKRINPIRIQNNPNVYTPKNRAPKYMKQKLIELKGEIDKFIIIVRNFNTFLSETHKNTKQKISKD